MRSNGAYATLPPSETQIDTPSPHAPKVPLAPKNFGSVSALIWPGPLVALRSLLFILVSIGLVLLASFRMLLAPATERRNVLEYTLHQGLALGRALYGLELHQFGQAAEGLDQPMLIVANHRTGLDTVVLHQALEGRSLAMDGVATWPLFNRLARAQGTLFVNRGSAGSRVAAIRGLRATLQQGHNVMVFPEGMMFPGDAVRPYFGGAFAAAKGYPVLCVGLAWPFGIEYLHDEPMPIRLLWRVRIPVCSVIGEPFVAGDDPRATAAEAQRRTTALVERARAEFDARNA